MPTESKISVTAKKVSCKRCQLRKLRCTRTEPCRNCQISGQHCEYRQLDGRKRPVQQEYVTGLENRVAWLERLLRCVKEANPEERESILDSVDFGDHLPPSDDSHGNILEDASSRNFGLQPDSSAIQDQQAPQDTFQVRPEGSVIYHGATSIYCAMRETRQAPNWNRPSVEGYQAQGEGASPRNDIYHGSDTNFNHVATHFGIDMQDELITIMLMKFFNWHYPQFMFIYREAFLRDHYGQRAGSSYWSTPLVLSMCALGALMSPEEAHRAMSEQFFSAAETILLVSGLARPCITTVQAYLCLAFYDIGRGELSRAWGFSGIAFRMIQDLGFQTEPGSSDTLAMTAEDIEIRRRIYWGCYVSDKTISLILGRPAQLAHSDAKVEDLSMLPNFGGMQSWLTADARCEESQLIMQGGPPNNLLCFREQLKLCKIVEKMFSSRFSPRSNLDRLCRKACVDELNLEMCRWYESLPHKIRWNRWEPSTSVLMTSIASLHMLYYSCRIVLHYDLTR